MAIFDSLNSLRFYSLVIVTVGFIGFSIYHSTNNLNDNVADRNVDTSSNNVNSGAGTQTENPSSSIGTINTSEYVYPAHELKYLELLKILGPEMRENNTDDLCLRYMIHSYPLEELSSSNFNQRIITRFTDIFFE